MLWVDYLIIGIVAVSAIIGVFRGFLREVISLAAWVLAFVLSYLFGRQVAELLSGLVSTPSLRLAAAYVGVFALVLLAGGIIGYVVSRAVSKSGLAGTDRAIGLVFGVIRGLALAVLLVLLAALTPAPLDPWWKESKSIQLIEPYAMWARDMLPEEVAANIIFAGEESKTAPEKSGETTPSAAPAASPPDQPAHTQ
jgi:membrane protein required for colicin V production